LFEYAGCELPTYAVVGLGASYPLTLLVICH